MNAKARFRRAVRRFKPLADDDPLALALIQASEGDRFFLDFVNAHLQPKSTDEIYALAVIHFRTVRIKSGDAEALEEVVRVFGAKVRNREMLKQRCLQPNGRVGKIVRQIMSNDDPEIPDQE